MRKFLLPVLLLTLLFRPALAEKMTVEAFKAEAWIADDTGAWGDNISPLGNGDQIVLYKGDKALLSLDGSIRLNGRISASATLSVKMGGNEIFANTYSQSGFAWMSPAREFNFLEQVDLPTGANFGGRLDVAITAEGETLLARSYRLVVMNAPKPEGAYTAKIGGSTLSFNVSPGGSVSGSIRGTYNGDAFQAVVDGKVSGKAHDLSADVSGTIAGKGEAAEAAPAAGGGAPGGKFPETGDFNGMSLSYSIGGVALNAPEDHEGFTTSRNFTGAITGSTVTVDATSSNLGGQCNTDYGSFWMQLDVSLTVNGKTTEYHSEKPCNRGPGPRYTNDLGPGKASLSLPVPQGEKATGSFTISMTYVNPRFGDRGLVVGGSLAGGSSGTPAEEKSLTGKLTAGYYVVGNIQKFSGEYTFAIEGEEAPKTGLWVTDERPFATPPEFAGSDAAIAEGDTETTPPPAPTSAPQPQRPQNPNDWLHGGSSSGGGSSGGSSSGGNDAGSSTGSGNGRTRIEW